MTLPDSIVVLLLIGVLFTLMFEIKRWLDQRPTTTPPVQESDHDHAEHQ